MRNAQIFILLILSSLSLHAGNIEHSILFTGNSRGLLTECACEIPAGGWARVAALRDSIGESAVFAAAGNQFFAHLPRSGDDQIFLQKKARLQAEIMKELHYDVINVGEFDLCYGTRFLQSLEEDLGLSLISANIRDSEGKAIFPPWHIVEREGLRIAFIGICSAKSVFNFKIADPLLCLEEVLLQDPHREADIVILLADASLMDLKPFLEEHPGIDLTIFSKEIYATPFTRSAESGSYTHLGSLGQFAGILKLRHVNTDKPWIDLSAEAQHKHSTEELLKASGKKASSSLGKAAHSAKKNFDRRSRKAGNYYYWDLIYLTSDYPERADIRERIQFFEKEKK